MGIEQEGIIKFSLDFDKSDSVYPEDIVDLNRWREKLFALKLIGQNPVLYDGLGYGNISHRVQRSNNGPSFVISGSQTSQLPLLSPEHYSLVLAANIEKNRIYAKGLVKPSSEALTHAAFYQASQIIQYVFHVHSSELWGSAKDLSIPMTAPAITYGTPQMAIEIRSMFDAGIFKERNIVAMGGHQDGIISFGSTADEAGETLVQLLKQ